MKIQKMEIKRYKSLLNLKLDDIGNLTIFIGKNSSGKSNIIEALNLFFNAFDSSIEKEIAPIDDSIWYDRIIDKDKPIEFRLTIQLNDEEKEKILSNQNMALRVIEWVHLYLFEHTRKDFEPEIFFVTKTVSPSLDDPNLVIQTLHKT